MGCITAGDLMVIYPFVPLNEAMGNAIEQVLQAATETTPPIVLRQADPQMLVARIPETGWFLILLKSPRAVL